MRQLPDIQTDEYMMATLSNLTGVFQGLASMRISQIKDQVIQSTKFYEQLWGIYTQIRAGNQFSFGRLHDDENVIDKGLYILITAEGGFSGEIDHKIIKMMLEDYDPNKHDVIVIGRHGAQQLNQAHVPFQHYFKMPAKDRNINVQPVVDEIKKYKSSTIFYPSYKSLLVQDIKKVEILSAVNELGENTEVSEDVINEDTYIFEPSTFYVVAHLERSMIKITLSQLILESKLAQYASRFQAMRFANDKATEDQKTFHMEYNRAKRAIKDARLKEIISGMRASRGAPT
jgi:ATP synthase F1 gamma subunit